MLVVPSSCCRKAPGRVRNSPVWIKRGSAGPSGIARAQHAAPSSVPGRGGAQPWVLLPRDTNAAPAAGGSMSAGRRRRERGGQVLTSVCRRSRADELCFPHFVMLLQTGMLPPPVGIGAPACALLSRHLPNPAEIDYSLRFNDSAFLLLLIY